MLSIGASVDLIINILGGSKDQIWNIF